MIQHLSIELSPKAYKNFFSMFMFILHSIIVNTINIGTIILMIMWDVIRVEVFHNLNFSSSLFLFVVYILIALEETYHITMIIHLNKQDTITNIDITKVNVCFFSFIGGVCVCYTGMFKKSDVFYISLAGPIMPILYLIFFSIVLFIIHVATAIDMTCILRLLLVSSVAPISAFIPIGRKEYFSDGYQIISFVRKNRVSLKNVICSIKYTIKTMLFMTVRFNG